MTMTFLLLFTFAPPPPPRVQPAPGVTCTLQKPLSTSAEAKGKGPRTRLGQGTTLEIVAIERPWLEVRVGESKGFTSLRQLRNACGPLALPAAKPAPSGEPAPVAPAPAP